MRFYLHTQVYVIWYRSENNVKCCVEAFLLMELFFVLKLFKYVGTYIQFIRNDVNNKKPLKCSNEKPNSSISISFMLCIHWYISLVFQFVCSHNRRWSIKLLFFIVLKFWICFIFKLKKYWGFTIDLIDVFITSITHSLLKLPPSEFNVWVCRNSLFSEMEKTTYNRHSISNEWRK